MSKATARDLLFSERCETQARIVGQVLTVDKRSAKGAPLSR